ncbi:hypothetical protein [Pseudomonas syringae group genomosp. 3]|uniref:hypothetical protein n=1 Tax=Pseudomonas syringae group genomosp. 3 TaxID=251701 RepID=UPI0006B8E08C|nr:hypothetical protein [Pseudomonas syringae group genomosp. 3]KPB82075.1 Uncharacterized protein AC505_0392 [Pseudomonas syringae pv. maculicola]
MNQPQNQDSAAEKAHQAALNLIYKHLHGDQKGTRDGIKEIQTSRGLVALDDLKEQEVAELLPAALKAEALSKMAYGQDQEEKWT